MKKLIKGFLILLILVMFVIIIVLATNIIFDKNQDKYNNSYSCCYDGMSDDYRNIVSFHAPCPCSDDLNILDKTLIVLGIKRR